MGTVDDVEVNGTQTLFHVCYEDFDEEDLDLGQLLIQVIYHPALNSLKENVVSLSEIDSFVLFSM